MPDAYGTTAGFKAYFIARGVDISIFNDDTVIDAKRLVGSEWIDGKFRPLFGGLKVGQRAQVRDWPRVGAFDIDDYPIDNVTVPTEVENATYEAAYRELISPGTLNVDWTPPRYKSASVDGAVSVQYMVFTSAMDVQTQFAIINQILAPILTGGEYGGNSSSLSGCASRV